MYFEFLINSNNIPQKKLFVKIDFVFQVANDGDGKTES